MAATCKHCGLPLVTVRMSDRCVSCGRPASVFRLSTADQALTRESALKKVQARIVAKPDRYGALAGPALTNPTLFASPLVLMTWQQAEQLACEWMRKNGYRDARLTRAGSDGGVDVLSRKAVAQVKHHAKPVGIAEMQRIFGIARSSDKKALFFSQTGYTPKARQWALAHDIEMYTYPPVRRIK